MAVQKKHQALLLALAGAVVLLGLQLYLVTGFRPDDDEPVTDWVYMIGEGARKPRRVAVAEVAALLGAHKEENAVVPSEKRLAVVLAFRDVGVERWPHAALAIPYLHRCVPCV
jgi:hypothetical protein